MGRPTNSLIGQRFGRLVVIERAENTENRQTKWLCQCDCGHTCVAYGINLKSGRKVNCGDCVGEDMNKEQMRQTSASLDRLRKDGEDPYQNLANAIVAVAADDYRTALKSGDRKLTTRLERFFHSGWYRTLTNLDADTLMGKLRQEHNGCLEAVYG